MKMYIGFIIGAAVLLLGNAQRALKGRDMSLIAIVVMIMLIVLSVICLFWGI